MWRGEGGREGGKQRVGEGNQVQILLVMRTRLEAIGRGDEESEWLQSPINKACQQRYIAAGPASQKARVAHTQIGCQGVWGCSEANVNTRKDKKQRKCSAVNRMLNVIKNYGWGKVHWMVGQKQGSIGDTPLYA